MYNQEKRDELIERGLSKDALLFDDPAFDNSIVEITENGCAVYSFALMIEEMMEDDKITEEEAIEFIITTPSEV